MGILALLASAARGAPMGTAINYQGRLVKDGSPVTSPPPHCDFTFGLWDAVSSGSPIGASPQFIGGVVVLDGLFSVNIDFGADAFNGEARWLEITLQCPGDAGPSMLTPRQELRPRPYALALPGLYTQQNTVSANLIGGYEGNVMGSGVVGGTISGGGGVAAAHLIADDFGTIGGGESNQAGSGDGNPTTQVYATVGGGLGNAAAASFATIGGGGRSNPADPATGNVVLDEYGTVGGGGNNRAGSGDGDPLNATFATVGGGEANAAWSWFATVGGGRSNLASTYATVGGGQGNNANSEWVTIGGGRWNAVTPLAQYATIGGGGPIWEGVTTSSNAVYDSYGTIGGGGNNKAGTTDSNPNFGTYCTIAGGNSNTAAATLATIGGGESNIASGILSTIGGGETNTASGTYSTVAGGGYNTAGGGSGTIAGGDHNLTSGPGSTVGGGVGNTASHASGYVTVAGGQNNAATGGRATIGGGRDNIASGAFAIIPGGSLNTVGGTHGFAAGRRAKVRDAVAAGEDPVTCNNTGTCGDEGTFVWADSTNADFTSTGPNQFLIRASGGMGLNTNSIPAGLLINTSSGAYLTTQGVWTSVSDREKKENFEPLNRQEVLRQLAAMPITRWNFKEQDSVRHIGPVAQDFYAAFGVGDDDKHIAAVDTAGVALAAIQGLHELLLQRDCEVEEVREENASLQQRLAALEAELAQLAARQNGGAR